MKEVTQKTITVLFFRCEFYGACGHRIMGKTILQKREVIVCAALWSKRWVVEPETWGEKIYFINLE